MQANPDKFQAITFGKKGISAITELIIYNKTIHCDDLVNLLGIEFYNILTFNNHIASMCKKAARQLAVGPTETYRPSPYNKGQTRNR